MSFNSIILNRSGGDVLKLSLYDNYVTVKLSRFGAWNSLDRCLLVRSQHRIRGFEERTTFYKRYNRKFLVNAASEQSLESDPGAYRPKSIWDSPKNALDAFYRFSRPHTVIGTVKFKVDVEKLSDISPLFFTGVLEAVVAALFMNIYIVGLNQLSDIDIDKVNKPYLPLASGEFSVGTGVMIVTSFSILDEGFWSIYEGGWGFGFGWVTMANWIQWTEEWLAGAVGLMGLSDGFCCHSLEVSKLLPLLRWKRFAVVAAMCILAVRAVIVQLAFFLHIQTHVYKRPAVFSRPLIFATAFMSFFSVVIALFKDIPDIDGDKIYGIRSFSVRLGQSRVFWTCISLLEMAYGVALLVGIASSSLWSKLITVLGHTILASVLWNRAKSVDLKSKDAITSFYMFIWKVT
uniref:Homogentisate phytyltransferase n=1 Tax=Fagus sylvatica TaxID=28930 RepID=A0A2N9HW89_FAGSY